MAAPTITQPFDDVPKMQTSGKQASGSTSNDHVRQELLASESIHLRTLCEIMTDTPLHFEEQIHRALQEGLAMLHLDLGIVSNIEGNKYTVLFFSPSRAPIQKGQVFDLNSTYCTLTIDKRDVVAIDRMADSQYSGHPCYSSFGLESYIGVPVLVEGAPYGTLNFSSTVPRSTPFSEADRNFVRLMGRWVGTCLSSNFREKELQSYRTELENLVTARTAALRKTNKRLLQEIEENTRARQALTKQQSFLNTLIETIPLPVFYKDTSGRYLGCNRAFEHFSQRKKSEIIGKTVYDLGPAEIADKYFEKDQKLFERGGTQQYEWSFRKNDGEDRNVIFQKATFEDEQGRLAGLIGTIFDITERKKMERQLFQAQKLQAIGTLSNGIAHDFNNILSAIMGYTELARMKLSESSQVRTDLDKIHTAGRRAVELVKQILTFSRQNTPTTQPVKVGPIIEEVLKLMRASLPATIEIRSTIQKDVTILADPTQLHQVLMNLCTNSGHAMVVEGGILEVTLDTTIIKSDPVYAEAGLPKGSFMKLQVRDTGAGIPQNIIDRIFDPFFTTKDTGEGTGLGLSVVHGIIKDLGGVIHVTSTPGTGSTFEILVPMAAGTNEPLFIDNKDRLLRGSESILFVDDEELLVDLGVRLLEKLGYSVTGCTSSREALNIFRENPDTFDLVITDETMPKMTGKMLAAELNQIRPKIPIILCSGFISSIEKEDAEAKGIKAFILKPILTRKMSRIVREVLDGTYSDSFQSDA
ncbi:MAG: ATP-binding protein [Desulforhopalus sp.]